MLINASQTMAAKYLYDAFGNTLAQSVYLAAANTYRFSSKEWNANSGLYYYLCRFYDPNLQRWVNRDPIGEKGGINLYEFNLNDPTDRFDPDGLEAVMGPEVPCDKAAYNGCAYECGKGWAVLSCTMRKVTIPIPATCFNTEGKITFNLLWKCRCYKPTPPSNN
jgi:RHS repeat-associated protein